MKQKGLVHLYTGDGKGKTTAAIGLAVRARGAGLRVLVVQFLKGQDTGELSSLRALGIPVLRSRSQKFVFSMTPDERTACRAEQLSNLERAAAKAGEYDLIVLDEVTGAIATKMLPLERVLHFIKEKPAGLEVALTGRDAPEELAALADYVSEIKSVRHPFEKGVGARKGIEF